MNQSSVIAKARSRTARRVFVPNPRKETYTVIEHGYSREINYGWLTDAKYGRRLRSHIKHENAYTNTSFRRLGIAKLAREIAKEMYDGLDENTGDLVEGSLNIAGNWVYYTRDTKKTVAPSYWRYPVGGDISQSQLLFDEAKEMKKLGGYIIFGDLQVSDDGKFAVITYCIDESEKYILSVRRIEDGKILCECKGVSVEVGSGDVPDFDGQGNAITYMRQGQLGKEKYLCRREFYASGRKGWKSKEERLYSEPNEDFWIGRETSTDDKWIILQRLSGSASEILLFDRMNLKEKPLRFAGLIKDMTYSVDILNDRAWIMADLSDDPDQGFGRGGEINVYTAPILNTSSFIRNRIMCPPSVWVKALTLPEGYILESYQIFDTFSVFGLRKDGLPRVFVAQRDGNGIHGELVQLGEPYQTLTAQILTSSPDHDSNAFQVTERGMHPDLVYEVKVEFDETGALVWERELIETKQVVRRRESCYPNSLEYAVASDGAHIPVALWKPADKPVVGTQLVVYGAYGESVHEFYYKPDWQSLLDRGVAIAVAYVRGGGELGRAWYDAGRLRRKGNTISDTLAVAQWLSQNDLAGDDGRNIVLSGGSAGGIAVGGALNANPSGFAGAVCSVPFVDCLTTMLDPTTPLTENEYTEWGNPSANKADWESIRDWSPVDNIKRGVLYPPVFVSGSLRDVRVGIWESARWVLSLRENSSQIYLKTNEITGHAGAVDEMNDLSISSETVAFTLWCLGWNKKNGAEVPFIKVNEKALRFYPVKDAF